MLIKRCNNRSRYGLDAFTARIAIMAGAEYIVGPSFDRQTAEICIYIKFIFTRLYDNY